MSPDRTKRYGCLKNGAADVKQHSWFKQTDWALCIARRLKPPFIPETRSPDDTSMFDEYPESAEGKRACGFISYLSILYLFLYYYSIGYYFIVICIGIEYIFLIYEFTITVSVTRVLTSGERARAGIVC